MRLRKLWVAAIAVMLCVSLAPIGALAEGSVVTLNPVASVEQGGEVEISGSSTLDEVIIKVLRPGNTGMVYYDIAEVVDGEYDVLFTLSSSEAAGTYTVVAGQGNQVASGNLVVTEPEVVDPPDEEEPPIDPVVTGPDDDEDNEGEPAQQEQPQEPAGALPAYATATVSEQNGRTVLTATVDAEKLVEELEGTGDNPVVVIPVTESTDQVSVVLGGAAVTAMTDKNAMLDIQTPIGGYKLPASEVKLDLLAMLLGAQGEESEVSVQVDIAKSDEAKVGLMWDAASRSGFTVVVPPVDFTVTASVGDRSVTVDTFSSFVEREIPIPEGIDAGMITSAVVLNEDGTTRSVPMKIVTRDGVSYAVINSLTNSTYTLVSHTAAFSDVENHWAKDAVNGMGSRMVINGTGDGLFSPDQAITRAEFAAIVVRGLGMKLEASAGDYSDVKAGDWYSSAVNAADAYDLISGFGDGTFRPNDKITREEAMVIIARAMAVTGLDAELSGLSTEETLGTYQDAAQVSAWAQSSVAEVVASGIVSGRSGTELAPMDYITRAEVAIVIERLLAQSGLI